MDGSKTPIAQHRAQQVQQEYQLGLAFFRRRHWKAATRHFRMVDQKSGRHDIHQHLYRSYHGLALVYSGDVSGLNLCRHAAARETIHATVFQNLARAEIHFRHRKRAWDAIRLGLQMEPADVNLLKLRREMGVRRDPCLPFLGRDNPLNKWLGKATYRRVTPGSASR